MKTLKILGIIAFAAMVLHYLYGDDQTDESYRYTQEDQFKQVGYQQPKPAPETVYVEVAPPPQQIEEQEQQVEWLFPTGTSRNAYPPGSSLEREWLEGHRNRRNTVRTRPRTNGGLTTESVEEIKKQYHPNYEITPVETNQ